MPKDWKRYTTAGLTFATIITIGFVMQNGQNNGPQDQVIATANMGAPVAPAALPEPGQDAVPAVLPEALPGSETSAAALGVNQPYSDQAPQDAATMPGLDMTAMDAGGETKLVASLANAITWGGRDRASEGGQTAASEAMQSGAQAAMQASQQAPLSETLSTRDASGAQYETAALGDAATAPLPATPREAPMTANSCEISLKASPQAAALVDLTLDAPCLPNERVTFHHNGMMFTETTGMNGELALSVPALTENAVFIASFANGEGAVANATVTSLGFYDRAVVQSEAENAVSLHALEFGADYGDRGHINADAPGDIAKAAAGEGGFLMVMGNPQIAKGIMAQVYSFPAGFTSAEGEIALSVEIEVTDANCGRPLDAQSIEALQGGKLSVQTLDLTMPDCDAVGDFLVLKNLVNDLKVAKN
ncbi:translocase [Rhodalgimonas zhirmunskyi]|uniref:Translocase n=1 Tax=Rhodalgimonas zhirmunskyi TaxID=2964767 RepID=A0AAJ1UAG0_9RHOB|nr:translocase [Rhodoalgimonas zhirmunskyi]MDQ2094258.1 translocase [Rhodoalgimonas zhirmunskyi]